MRETYMYYLNFEPRSNSWVCICYIINIWTSIFKTGILLPRLLCQNKYATKYMITPCTYYIIYLWSKILQYDTRLGNLPIFLWTETILTIWIISMHCNGDILRNQSTFQFSSNKILICLITNLKRVDKHPRYVVLTDDGLWPSLKLFVKRMHNTCTRFMSWNGHWRSCSSHRVISSL